MGVVGGGCPNVTSLDLSELSECTILGSLEINLACENSSMDKFRGALVVLGLEELPASCPCVVLVPSRRPPGAGLPFIQVAPGWELVVLEGPEGIAHYRRVQV